MCLSLSAECFASDHLAQSQAAAPLLDNEFDLSEQILKAIFQKSIPVNILKLIQFPLITK